MDLIEMYPAVVNSKVTVTLGVLNADSTIIEVLDGSVLPDAPNLLVLGSDQTAETVKMTAKDGNALIVERGIQGIANAWPAGTQIARNFTAKDWDDMVANINTIVAKILGLSAGDVGALPADKKVPVQNGGLAIDENTTEEDKAEAVENIKEIGLSASDIGARPNANLLHNWYFGNPVNRNGKTEYTGVGGAYTIDRWRITNSNSALAVESDKCILSGLSSPAYLQQFVTIPSSLLGKKVTISFLVNDELYTKTGVIPTAIPTSRYLVAAYDTASGSSLSTGVWFETNGTLMVQVSAGTEKSSELQAAKLELGDTQTLAHQDENGNWILNEIPDYAEQYAICCQYDKTSGAYLGLTPKAVGALPIYTSLDDLGLSDDDMIADDFGISIKTILSAMPDMTMANITTTGSTPNLALMIYSKLNAEIGTSFTQSNYVTIVINKWKSINAMSEIRVFVDSSVHRGRIYTCIYDTSNGAQNISTFTPTYLNEGFLPLDGSVPMSGMLKQSVSNGAYNSFLQLLSGHWFFTTYGTDFNTRRVLDLKAVEINGNIKNAFVINEFVDGVAIGEKAIFGEHNKPSGSYTGNGSATTRTIDTGGIGNVLKIRCATSLSFICPDVAVCFHKTNGVTIYNPSVAKFENGVLTLNTDVVEFNYNGTTYKYEF